MEQAKVFISSILNTGREDLRQERDVAREVVTSYRFLKPWAFEKAPASFEDLDESYLRHVDECDLFILIVGIEATNPVTAECLRAKERNKPILLFAKESENRTPLARALLESVGVKYATFRTVEELRQSIADAIDQALVSGLRALQDRSVSRTVLHQLRELAEKFGLVHVRPIIPSNEAQDKFQVQEVSHEVVTLAKLSGGLPVHIPAGRICEVLHFGNSDVPALLLDGRLQWVTASESWKFFEDKPGPDSSLGFSKISSNNDPRALEIIESHKKRGFKFYWDHIVNLGARLGDGWELVYDDDGRYFRVPDRSGDLVLIRRKE